MRSNGKERMSRALEVGRVKRIYKWLCGNESGCGVGWRGVGRPRVAANLHTFYPLANTAAKSRALSE